MNMNEFEKSGRWQFSQRPDFVTFLGIIIILQFFSYRMQRLRQEQRALQLQVQR